jgi:hypothetical protein
MQMMHVIARFIVSVSPIDHLQIPDDFIIKLSPHHKGNNSCMIGYHFTHHKGSNSCMIGNEIRNMQMIVFWYKRVCFYANIVLNIVYR